MTPIESTTSGTPHVGELRFRRFRIGELSEADDAEVARHVPACGQCRARLRTLEEEQRQFEREIPFERFAGGVERARRAPHSQARPHPLFALGALGCAAAAAFLLVARTSPLRPSPPQAVRGEIRVKSAAPAEATIRIATRAESAPQRSAAPGSVLELRAGERIRIGYRALATRHLVAISIDEAGAVTALYPDSGDALRVEPTQKTRFLPDSLEFTGAGHERVFLVLSERALVVEQVAAAARAAHARHRGALPALSSLPLGDQGIQQFTWLFRKP